MLYFQTANTANTQQSASHTHQEHTYTDTHTHAHTHTHTNTHTHTHQDKRTPARTIGAKHGGGLTYREWAHSKQHRKTAIIPLSHPPGTPPPGPEADDGAAALGVDVDGPGSAAAGAVGGGAAQCRCALCVRALCAFCSLRALYCVRVCVLFQQVTNGIAYQTVQHEEL